MENDRILNIHGFSFNLDHYIKQEPFMITSAEYDKTGLYATKEGVFRKQGSQGRPPKNKAFYIMDYARRGDTTAIKISTAPNNSQTVGWINAGHVPYRNDYSLYYYDIFLAGKDKSGEARKLYTSRGKYRWGVNANLLPPTNSVFSTAHKIPGFIQSGWDTTPPSANYDQSMNTSVILDGNNRQTVRIPPNPENSVYPIYEPTDIKIIYSLEEEYLNKKKEVETFTFPLGDKVIFSRDKQRDFSGKLDEYLVSLGDKIDPKITEFPLTLKGLLDTSNPFHVIQEYRQEHIENKRAFYQIESFEVLMQDDYRSVWPKNGNQEITLSEDDWKNVFFDSDSIMRVQYRLKPRQYMLTFRSELSDIQNEVIVTRNADSLKLEDPDQPGSAIIETYQAKPYKDFFSQSDSVEVTSSSDASKMPSLPYLEDKSENDPFLGWRLKGNPGINLVLETAPETEKKFFSFKKDTEINLLTNNKNTDEIVLEPVYKSGFQPFYISLEKEEGENITFIYDSFMPENSKVTFEKEKLQAALKEQGINSELVAIYLPESSPLLSFNPGSRILFFDSSNKISLNIPSEDFSPTEEQSSLKLGTILVEYDILDNNLFLSSAENEIEKYKTDWSFKYWIKVFIKDKELNLKKDFLKNSYFTWSLTPNDLLGLNFIDYSYPSLASIEDGQEYLFEISSKNKPLTSNSLLDMHKDAPQTSFSIKYKEERSQDITLSKKIKTPNKCLIPDIWIRML